jgi:predicted RNA-binding protein with TRAM domain
MSCLVHFVALLLVLGITVGARGDPAVARQTRCAPVVVGEDTGVYFLALGENCDARAPSEGYTVIAHLVRDDDSSEVLVLVDAEHDDAETVEVARILAERLKAGRIDGETWHDQPG